MIFFEDMRKGEKEESLINFLDCCFEEVKIFVEHGSFRLNNSRIKFRTLAIKEARREFDCFKELCIGFLTSLKEIKGLVKYIEQSKKVDKIILTSEEIVKKTTQRIIKSKIPIPEIDYLKSNSITESDIDWMLKRIKNFWNKFLQVYGSIRFDIILSNLSR